MTVSGGKMPAPESRTGGRAAASCSPSRGRPRSSQMVHKSLMDVAETGTEAAAATGVRKMRKSERIPRASVKFNRPFLFAILSEDTQGILFCGKVANPRAASGSLPLVAWPWRAPVPGAAWPRAPWAAGPRPACSLLGKRL
ncbi:Serine proteinase inhibitor 2.4 [Myotis davidii]|uniref:Serine proteinase inhibitor 2.4 n=1 Tax=Myotis davidii TaxID=225400 RepID=L5LM22_MYODS|nr:Serine proteinase inhibitor 2.4 [Myotis davidii]